MKILRIDPVRKFPGSINIRDFQKGVIVHAIANVLLCKFMGEKVMPIHIKLETEGCPGGDTQIAQPQFLVNEIKVIMKAFALVKLEGCPASGLIMPWPIGITLFHGGKNMDQPLGPAGLLDDLLDTVILTESTKLADKFNFNAVLIRDTLRVLPDLFCKRLGETCKIENTDVVGFHIGCHAIRMAPSGNIPLDDHAVIAGDDTINLVSVFIRK